MKKKKEQPQLLMSDSDGKIQGKIVRLRSKRCKIEGCLSFCASVRWPDGTLTYPCMSMVKQITETEYQICHTSEVLAKKGLTIKPEGNSNLEK